MDDDIDARLIETSLIPPRDFAARLTALARTTPQVRRPSRGFRRWQWATLAAGATLGALRLCEFVFAAFLAAGAR